MNFSITLIKTLEEAELRILSYILFYSIITAGKKEFLKKGFDFFEDSRNIGDAISWN